MKTKKRILAIRRERIELKSKISSLKEKGKLKRKKTKKLGKLETRFEMNLEKDAASSQQNQKRLSSNPLFFLKRSQRKKKRMKRLERLETKSEMNSGRGAASNQQNQKRS